MKIMVCCIACILNFYSCFSMNFQMGTRDIPEPRILRRIDLRNALFKELCCKATEFLKTEENPAIAKCKLENLMFRACNLAMIDWEQQKPITFFIIKMLDGSTYENAKEAWSKKRENDRVRHIEERERQLFPVILQWQIKNKEEERKEKRRQANQCLDFENFNPDEEDYMKCTDNEYKSGGIPDPQSLYDEFMAAFSPSIEEEEDSNDIKIEELQNLQKKIYGMLAKQNNGQTIQEEHDEDNDQSDDDGDGVLIDV